MAVQPAEEGKGKGHWEVIKRATDEVYRIQKNSRGKRKVFASRPSQTV